MRFHGPIVLLVAIYGLKQILQVKDKLADIFEIINDRAGGRWQGRGRGGSAGAGARRSRRLGVRVRGRCFGVMGLTRAGRGCLSGAGRWWGFVVRVRSCGVRVIVATAAATTTAAAATAAAVGFAVVRTHLRGRLANIRTLYSSTLWGIRLKGTSHQTQKRRVLWGVRHTNTEVVKMLEETGTHIQATESYWEFC
jgi:hypothetical protein